MEDFDIPQNKMAESAERVVDRALDEARRRDHALLDERARVPGVRASRMGHVRPGHARSRAQPARDPAGARRAPAAAAERARPRSARRPVHEAAVQARAAARQPIRTAHHRGDGSLLGDFRRDAGHPGLDHPAPRHRARSARHAPRDAHARPRAARGAPEEALRAAALPQTLRHEPEPAGAPGQGAAGLRPRLRDGPGHRGALPPRARQLGPPARRAGRRQDGDRRRARAPHRVRAGEGAGAAARLPDRQPADEHDGRGNDAARHVRGSDPERHPRDQGAAEPDPVHRRSAHDDRRGLGARRPVRRGQRLQVGAGARRGPDRRRDDAERVQGVHPGGRGARAPLPHRARRGAVDRADAQHPLQPAPAPRAQLLGPHQGRSDRDRARDVAALHAAPPAARQGHRLARYRGGQGRDRPPLGSDRRRRRERDLEDRADSRRHGVPRGDRPLHATSRPGSARGSSGSGRRSMRSPGGWCSTRAR